MPEFRQDCIIIKRNMTLLAFAVVTLYIGNLGLEKLELYFRRDSMQEIHNLLKVAIMLTWTNLHLIAAAVAFRAGMVRLRLDAEGVHLHSLFRKRTLLWHHVQDWGISCDPTRRLDFKVSHLYFSPEKLPVRTGGGKRFTNGVIKVVVLPRDLENFRQRVLPFCAEKIDTPSDGDAQELC